MRVMILTADYAPGSWSGIGVAVERQARALASLGIETHVLVANRAIDMPGASGTGPHVHQLSRQRCPVDPRQFDVVHLHSLALSELAEELRRRFDLPLVYTAHSLLRLELQESADAGLWCAVQERILTISDGVVFLSRAERLAAVAGAPELATRSYVIPNGVPAPPDSLPPPEEEGPIVFAGRFARSKGVELLGQLIPRVLARWPGRFVLAGGHGDTAGTRIVQNIAAQFPGACRVPGWLNRNDLDALFAASAVVLVPSRYEPFGLVALEAMRAGAPVLAAGVGGLTEVVAPESGGRLVYSRDPEVWCRALLEIVSTPAVREALRRRGPQYVKAHFDSTRMAERLVAEVYSACAAGRA